MLQLLTVFAEWERSVIRERTRSKVAASRRKGLWCGGRPPMGYTVVDKKLVIRSDEAEQVRAIFREYLEQGSLLATCEELRKRGWHTRAWKTAPHGHAFDRAHLHRMLTNVVYRGQVTLHEEIHPGQHQAIVDEQTWDAVQAQLRAQRRERPVHTRNKWSIALAGLVRCAVCNSGFVHHYASRRSKRYSYLVCNTMQQRGAAACPGSRVAARDLEAFVIDRIRQMGRDPTLVAATVEAARREVDTKRPAIEAEVRRLDQERRQAETERVNLVSGVAIGGPGVPALLERLGEIEETLRKAGERVQDQRQALAAIEGTSIHERDLAAALAAFDHVWEKLVPRERARVLRLLIEKVTFNGQTGDVAITFRASGVIPPTQA